MSQLGVTVQVLAGNEIFQALQTGAVDAAEWVGPYDDEKLGFQKVAQFYYYPGWWEPGPSLEVEINLNKWKELPKVYQEIVKTAAFEANMTMLARYDAKNRDALKKLTDGGVQLKQFSPEIMQAAEQASFQLFDGFAGFDDDFGIDAFFLQQLLGVLERFEDAVFFARLFGDAEDCGFRLAAGGNDRGKADRVVGVLGCVTADQDLHSTVLF